MGKIRIGKDEPVCVPYGEREWEFRRESGTEMLQSGPLAMEIQSAHLEMTKELGALRKMLSIDQDGEPRDMDMDAEIAKRLVEVSGTSDQDLVDRLVEKANKLVRHAENPYTDSQYRQMLDSFSSHIEMIDGDNVGHVLGLKDPTPENIRQALDSRLRPHDVGRIWLDFHTMGKVSADEGKRSVG